MNVGGIVLCGGKSTRMGVSKADLSFGPNDAAACGPPARTVNSRPWSFAAPQQALPASGASRDPDEQRAVARWRASTAL